MVAIRDCGIVLASQALQLFLFGKVLSKFDEVIFHPSWSVLKWIALGENRPVCKGVIPFDDVPQICVAFTPSRNVCVRFDIETCFDKGFRNVILSFVVNGYIPWLREHSTAIMEFLDPGNIFIVAGNDKVDRILAVARFFCDDPS